MSAGITGKTEVGGAVTESEARDTVRRNPNHDQRLRATTEERDAAPDDGFGQHPGPDAELPRQTQVRRGSGTSNETVQPVKTMRVDPEPTLRPLTHDLGRPAGASTFFLWMALKK